MPKNQRGFAHLALILVIIVLAVVAGAGYLIYSKNQDSKDSSSGQSRQDSNALKASDDSCKPASAGLFTSDVTDLNSVTVIQNPIRLVGGNNIKTHSFIEVSKRTPVYAPMDATLTGGSNYYEMLGPKPVTKVQYIMSFNDGCDVSFWLDHIVDVPDKIKTAFPAEASNDTRDVSVQKTEVKAGELVGYSNQDGSARFDFGAINRKGPETSLTTNPRFKDNPVVKTSDKYRFATCPYNLYSSDKQKSYKSLYDSSVTSDQKLIDNICQ